MPNTKLKVGRAVTLRAPVLATAGAMAGTPAISANNRAAPKRLPIGFMIFMRVCTPKMREKR